MFSTSLAFFGADSAAMAEQLQWFAGKPEYASDGLALASATEAYGGHLVKARELTKRAVDAAIRADRRKAGRLSQAMLPCERPLSAMLRKRGSRRQRL